MPPKPRKPIIKNENGETVRLHLSLSKLTMDKITELQGMYAHKKLDLAEIVDLMASALLEKNLKRALHPKTCPSRKPISGPVTKPNRNSPAIPKKNHNKWAGKCNSYIPIAIRRGVLTRAGFKCENCSSTFALQFEHRMPVALGGRNTAENIFLLSRNCNFRRGVTIFGVAGMGAR